MKKVAIIEDQNIIDIVIASYGNAESVVNFCLHNSIDINGDMTPGDFALIDPTVPYSSTGVVSAPVKQITRQDVVVVENQNLIDTVIQEYAGVEGLVQMCSDNALGLSGILQAGTKLKVNPSAVVSKQLSQYLKKNRITIGTEENEVTMSTRIFDFSFDFSFE